MEFEKLASILHDMYFDSEDGESVVMIHLFGIKYAREIKACNESMKQFAISAGLNESYGTEISKGVKLAQFVTPKF